MFTPEMIAPCGLDCSLCSEAHRREGACLGCNGPDERKPEFCSVRCDVVNCEKRGALGGARCDACADYPCEYILERERRYATLYALTESPMDNLRAIRELGMEGFLDGQRERWTCPDCGGVISVHTGVCSGCARAFGRRGMEE